ncbi:AAA family ATPase [Methylobacterium radiotolerans]|uniref:AAA family ATPase n=1 Tax=Methylobacterium radiotolerans TaxID=31998 RepID=UPI000D5FC068|nr:MULTISPECIES: AAA family ATPase [Methylobacterium]MDE3749570.1 AAA family ATPase [Methylobacterium radiotolerans]PVZ05949.1 ATP-dependent Zn protease [Methylobacterium organophilum]
MSKKTPTPKPPSRIQNLRKTGNPAADLDRAFDELEPHNAGHRLPLTDLASELSVSTVLAAAMLYEALTPRDRRRIARCRGLAMTVAVATADWIDPVVDALRRAHEWREVFKRHGASRTSDKPEVGNDACAGALAAGRSALGVSTAPERYLPSALLAVADLRVTLGNPSTQAVRSAIQVVTGRRPGPLPIDLVRGLSPTEIVACIRKGSTASACVRRLRTASASKRTDVEVGLEAVPALADCLGYGEAQEWGLRLVSAIEEYRRGERAWESVEDRNIVLSGDAGVGKTTFARSLAKSAGVPLIATSVSTWFASGGGYLNEIVRAVDALFARAAAIGGPVVVLLDECDNIPNRATVDARYRDFWVPIISHILLALDSAVSGENSRLVVIGATNFPDRLDEALVRPGRLNRIVHIPRPDIPAVAGILRQHLGNALPGVDLMPLANIGAGATGAEIAGWAKGARMMARQDGRDMVLGDLVDQIVPPETRSPDLLRAISRHEAAHAAATILLGLGTITNVSLVARGGYAGRTSARLRDTGMMSAADLDALVVSILAGRAADEHWGRITSGAGGSRQSDLAHATALVAGKHGAWGLGVSLLYRGDQSDAMSLIRTDPAFRKVIEADLQDLFERARGFVQANALTIDRLAQRLMERRVLGGDEVHDIVGVPPRDDVGDTSVTTVGGAAAEDRASAGGHRHG